MEKTQIDAALIIGIYFGLLIIYIVIKTIFNSQKMKALGMPAEYRKLFNIGQIISFAGLAWLFFTIFR